MKKFRLEKNIKDSIWVLISRSMWGPARSSVRDSVRDSVWGSLWNSAWGSAWSSVNNSWNLINVDLQKNFKRKKNE